MVSAHRTPDLLFEYAERGRGARPQVIIAGAGGAAHLPGMAAAKTALPVLGVPIESKPLKGIDSLLSIVADARGGPGRDAGDRPRRARSTRRCSRPRSWRAATRASATAPRLARRIRPIRARRPDPHREHGTVPYARRLSVAGTGPDARSRRSPLGVSFGSSTRRRLPRWRGRGARRRLLDDPGSLAPPGSRRGRRDVRVRERLACRRRGARHCPRCRSSWARTGSSRRSSSGGSASRRSLRTLEETGYRRSSSPGGSATTARGTADRDRAAGRRTSWQRSSSPSIGSCRSSRCAGGR